MQKLTKSSEDFVKENTLNVAQFNEDKEFKILDRAMKFKANHEKAIDKRKANLYRKEIKSYLRINA